MLHAACSCCRSIVPLYCSGAMMPHFPVPVFQMGTSPVCQLCGPLPPIFICMNCGMRQPVLLAGAAVPRGIGAGASYVAPVFEAPQNSSPDFLREAVLSFVKGFGGAAGKGAMQLLANQFSAGPEFGAY